MMIRLLCIAALLEIAPGTAMAQSKPPAQATAPSVPASSHERISGEFVYIGGEKEAAARNAAIDDATDDMFFAIRGTARRRIRNSTPIAPRVRIAFGDGNISVFSAGDPPAVSPENGKAISQKSREGDMIKLSQQITADDRLTQTFVGDDGGQIIVFTVSPDGKTLSVSHTIRSSHLPKDVRWTLTYQRSRSGAARRSGAMRALSRPPR